MVAESPASFPLYSLFAKKIIINNEPEHKCEEDYGYMVVDGKEKVLTRDDYIFSTWYRQTIDVQRDGTYDITHISNRILERITIDDYDVNEFNIEFIQYGKVIYELTRYHVKLGPSLAILLGIDNMKIRVKEMWGQILLESGYRVK
jgi:hypothetical protein